MPKSSLFNYIVDYNLIFDKKISKFIDSKLVLLSSLLYASFPNNSEASTQQKGITQPFQFKIWPYLWV